MAKFIKPYLPQCVLDIVVGYLVPPTDPKVLYHFGCFTHKSQNTHPRTAYNEIRRNKYQGVSLTALSGIGECYYCGSCAKVFASVERHDQDGIFYRKGYINAIEYDNTIIISTPTFGSIKEFLDMSKYVKYHWYFPI